MAVSRPGVFSGGLSGAVITPFGKLLIERYRLIERAAATAARKHLVALRSDIGKRGKKGAATTE